MKKTTPTDVKKGEVVLVQDENTKRGQWKLGLIEERITGKDDQVRGVLVRMCGKGKPQFMTMLCLRYFGFGRERRERNTVAFLSRSQLNSTHKIIQ